ncbi:hypothetical protein CDD81_7063 [Ophiocordyceps australis]|uniref:Uncharacterized protein n=1 Tax=Ophiocordyceps australis TaxID=1399860 RepID=A0A2C5Y4Y4_9HYPO|nr:hypothetical protein CDD81_7063 [Ophiocordyceps australis]
MRLYLLVMAGARTGYMGSNIGSSRAWHGRTNSGVQLSSRPLIHPPVRAAQQLWRLLAAVLALSQRGAQLALVYPRRAPELPSRALAPSDTQLQRHKRTAKQPLLRLPAAFRAAPRLASEAARLRIQPRTCQCRTCQPQDMPASGHASSRPRQHWLQGSMPRMPAAGTYYCY